MSEPVIELDGAVVARRRRLALHGVSLRVARGEFVGVIGPNGAGKTTLLMLLNGLAPLRSGRARVLQTEPSRGGYRLRRRVGYVAQVETVDPRLPISVRESVLLGRYGRLRWFRGPVRADWDRVEDALARVGMAHLADRPLGHLSGGEYQRVAIARVLAQEPELFLYDEPTASVDPQAQDDLLELIRRVHEGTGSTALFVTHDVRLAGPGAPWALLPACCTRLVLMRDGRIWREGPREAMLQPEVLRALYQNGREAGHGV